MKRFCHGDGICMYSEGMPMDSMRDFEESFPEFTEDQRMLLVEYFTARKEHDEYRAKYNELTAKWLSAPSAATRQERDDYYDNLLKPRIDEVQAIREQLLRLILRTSELDTLQQEFLNGLQQKFGKPTLKQAAHMLTDMAVDGWTVESLKTNLATFGQSLIESSKGSVELLAESVKQSLSLPVLTLLLESDTLTRDEIAAIFSGKRFGQ